jgi:hypothetical protein
MNGGRAHAAEETTAVIAHRSCRSVLAAGAVVAFAAAAPAAQASVLTFGSELSAPANVTEARQADTAYWQTTFANGASPLAPVGGQITSVKLKGIALSDPKPGVSGGETMWHLQALREQPDGTFKILRSSQPFEVPRTGDPQQISSYQPENFCVDKGDVLAFNTVGGWDGIATGGPYPNGTPLLIFSGVPGGSVSQFSGADQTNNGDQVRANHSRGNGQELLMQLTMGTAADSVFYCPGGLFNPYKAAPRATGGGTTAPKPKAAQKATIPKQRITVSRKGKLSIALFCQPGVTRCSGSVQLLSRRRTPRKLASARYTIASKSTGKTSLTLSPSARRMFRHGGNRLDVNIVAETTPGGVTRISTAAATLIKRGL